MSIFNIFKPIQRRFRRYFRQRMLPMTVDEAEEKREFFSKLYFLCSFLTLTYLTYKMYLHKISTFDPSVSTGEAAIERFKLDGKIRILKFEGFKKVEDYYYERKNEETEDDEKQNLDPELIVDAISNGESEVY